MQKCRSKTDYLKKMMTSGKNIEDSMFRKKGPSKGKKKRKEGNGKGPGLKVKRKKKRNHGLPPWQSNGADEPGPKK